MRVTLETKKRAALLVEQSGLSLNALAKAVGVSYSTLWNFLNGDTRNFGKIQELADALGVSLYELTTGSFREEPSRRAQAADSARDQAFGHNDDRDNKIPVFQTMPGQETCQLDATPMEFAPRLIGTGVAQVFAVKMRGDTMAPRYYWGDIVYCGRDIPPDPGDDCLIEKQDRSGVLKIYVGQDKESYIFRQLNPAQEWRCPMDDVRALHKVIARC